MKKFIIPALVSLAIALPMTVFASTATPNFSFSYLTSYLDCSSSYDVYPNTSSTVTLEAVQWPQNSSVANADVVYELGGGGLKYDEEIIGNFTNQDAYKYYDVVTGITYSLTLYNGEYFNSPSHLPGGVEMQGNGYLFYQ